MASDEATALQNLLTTFKATCLGEGDINAGTNLLATMACSLANIARTGSGIQPRELSRMRAGASLLVSGGLSSSLIRDDVVTEVAVRQNNLTAQLRRLIGDKIADAQKQGLKVVEFPAGPKCNYAENALFQLQQKESFIPLEHLEKWAEVLELPPNPRPEDLAARPKVLITARSPQDLERQLRGLHDNRPLIALGLHSPADVTGLAETCSTLLDGLYPSGDGGETVAGHLLLTDSGNVLAEIAPNASDKATWLGRLVWLVDGDAGPDAIEVKVGAGKARVDDMGGRFGEALSAGLAKRLNNQDASPTVHKFDLGPAQFRWVKFLQGMEGRLPGITGTARGLLATLAFGLIELASAPNFQHLPVSPAEVEGLARWIIRRMANARAAMVATAKREWRLHLARRILFKLGEGSLPKRDLYRSLSIPAGLCDELLLALEPAGLVREVEKRWERTTVGMLLEADTKTLFLEV